MSRDRNLLDCMTRGIVAKKAEICKMLDIPNFRVRVSDEYPQVELIDDHGLFAALLLEMYPGCCGATISYNMYVSHSSRGKGLGKLLLKMQEEASLGAGYTTIWATTVPLNPAANHILENMGYTKVYNFTSARTGNTITVWTKNLRAQRLADKGI